jgi:hypothetical protein
MLGCLDPPGTSSGETRLHTPPVSAACAALPGASVLILFQLLYGLLQLVYARLLPLDLLLAPLDLLLAPLDLLLAPLDLLLAPLDLLLQLRGPVVLLSQHAAQQPST